MKNTCYTYFLIRGDFEPQTITDMLQLMPEEVHKPTDLRKNGTPYGFGTWSYGRCDEYDVITENQIKKTISALMDKIDILNEIREKFDADLTIEIVPKVHADGSTPTLSPDLDIIDFCHATRTKIDIDLYIE